MPHQATRAFSAKLADVLGRVFQGVEPSVPQVRNTTRMNPSLTSNLYLNLNLRSIHPCDRCAHPDGLLHFHIEDLAEGRGPDWEEQLPDCEPAYQTVHFDTFGIDGGESKSEWYYYYGTSILYLQMEEAALEGRPSPPPAGDTSSAAPAGAPGGSLYYCLVLQWFWY